MVGCWCRRWWLAMRIFSANSWCHPGSSLKGLNFTQWNALISSSRSCNVFPFVDILSVVITTITEHYPILESYSQEKTAQLQCSKFQENSWGLQLSKTCIWSTSICHYFLLLALFWSVSYASHLSNSLYGNVLVAYPVFVSVNVVKLLGVASVTRLRRASFTFSKGFMLPRDCCIDWNNLWATSRLCIPQREFATNFVFIMVDKCDPFLDLCICEYQKTNIKVLLHG